jgi:Spy/CpxP family protein refolding chaperone
MMSRIVMASLFLLAAATPLAGQRPAERLEELRMRRLQDALRLDDEEAAVVAGAMEEVRRVEREARRRELAALGRLRAALQSDPVDQVAIREALDAIDAERETIVRVRREQAERLEQRLTPEQRGKLMLFNRQFEHRLRALLIERRGSAPMRRPVLPPGRRP